MESEFVPLICPQCGGKIEIKTKVLDELFVEIDGGDMYMYIGTGEGAESILCAHCKVAFTRRQTAAKIKLEFDGGNLTVDTGGGAWIGGSINVGGGDFVGRDKTIVISRQ